MSSTAITQQSCSYCGGFHSGVCPRVESIEYYENGTIRRVVLRDPVVRDPQGRAHPPLA